MTKRTTTPPLSDLLRQELDAVRDALHRGADVAHAEAKSPDPDRKPPVKRKSIARHSARTPEQPR